MKFGEMSGGFSGSRYILGVRGRRTNNIEKVEGVEKSRFITCK